MQTNDEKKLVYEALRKLAMMKGQEITEERHVAYCEYLSNYNAKDVLKSLKTLLDTLPRFPDISDIVKIIEPPVSQDDKANEIAGLIIECISRFGYANTELAKKEIGPLGWFVVERAGGWTNVCATTNKELGILKAQLRDMAKVASKIEKRDSLKLEHHERSSNKKLSQLLDEFNQPNRQKAIDVKI